MLVENNVNSSEHFKNRIEKKKEILLKITYYNFDDFDTYDEDGKKMPE